MSRHVLVAEDSATQREQLRSVLAEAGFEVTAAPDAETAIEVLRARPVDLIISDIVMPGMDGYDFCREVKQRHDIPVMLLTSLTDPLDVVHGLEAGADNFLRKPFDPDHLVERAHTILHNSDLRRSGRAQMGLELYFLGRRFMVTSDRQQILDLLVSTFEDLVRANEELRTREGEVEQARAMLDAQLGETERERRRLAAVIAAVPEALFIFAEDGTLIQANQAAAKLFETPVEEMLGRHPEEIGRLVDLSGRELPSDGRPLAVALAQHSTHEVGGAFDVLLERPGAATIPVVAQAAPIEDVPGHVLGAVGLIKEIGALSGHNPVTGLPNHTLFAERVRAALQGRSRSDSAVAVLVMSLDRFERVLAGLGPSSSDFCVAEIAGRFGAVLAEASPRRPHCLAQLGSAHFAAVIGDVNDPAEARRLAEKLAGAVQTVIEVDDLELRITASIGIAVSWTGEDDADQLILSASAAAQGASEAGGARQVFADARLGSPSGARLRREAELARAIESGQIVVHYQPEIHLPSRAPVGAEALVRWHHPSLGLVPPGEFIPLAEQSGLIVPLGWHVLQEACRQAAEWVNGISAGRGFTVSVNLSARQLEAPDAVGQVRRALSESRLDPRHLLLEITETGLLSDSPEVTERARQIQRLGVRIRIDDFGTGYATLAQLRRFPAAGLKIDRSFVAAMLDSPEDHAIVAATIGLGKGLGLDLVAEGVETPEHEKSLGALGCDFAQGWLWAKALPAGEFADWWVSRHAQLDLSR